MSKLLPRAALAARALVATGIAVLGASADAGPIAQSDAPAVVQIEIRDENSQPRFSGSGTIIDAQGDILTNYHVLQPALETPGWTWRVLLTPHAKGEEPFPGITAGLVATDPVRDLALLKATEFYSYDDHTSHELQSFLREKKTCLPYAQFARDSFSDEGVDPGDDLWILGYPLTGGSTITYTKGVVSGFSRRGTKLPWVKTDAKINPGNSGGAAFDARGNFVGVPVAVGTLGGGGGEIGYIISLPVVNGFLREHLGKYDPGFSPLCPDKSYMAPDCRCLCRSGLKWDVTAGRCEGDAPAALTQPSAPSGEIATLERTCADGDMKACASLGWSYLKIGASRDPARAAMFFEKACDGGDSINCMVLGVYYLKGKTPGIPKDPAHAVALLQKACDGRSATGCRLLGEAYWDGKDVALDLARAALLFQKACELGPELGCSDLGLAYSNGRGVPKDPVQAVAAFQKACDAGSIFGCYSLGLLYLKGRGIPKDLPRAAGLFQKACDAGSNNGCTNLGFLYFNGKGVPKDPARAVTLFQKACHAGTIVACANLGFAYLKGEGIAQDPKAAVSLFQEACDAQNAIGCTGLGVAYTEGKGVSLDLARGLFLFQNACGGGDPAGCWRLGVAYADGNGILRDAARAASLFQRACDGDDADGCFRLGVLYRDGKGVVRDQAKAHSFFEGACADNNAAACAALRNESAPQAASRLAETPTTAPPPAMTPPPTVRQPESPHKFHAVTWTLGAATLIAAGVGTWGWVQVGQFEALRASSKTTPIAAASEASAQQAASTGQTVGIIASILAAGFLTGVVLTW